MQCPFHCHHGDEEMFLILEGEGELPRDDAQAVAPAGEEPRDAPLTEPHSEITT